MPSPVKANLLFTQGMISGGDVFAKKHSFFLQASNDTPALPPIRRRLYAKEARKFSARKTAKPLALRGAALKGK
jgi:hypothetical protein